MRAQNAALLCILLLLHGTAEEANRAKAILEQTRPGELERHAGAAAARTA